MKTLGIIIIIILTSWQACLAAPAVSVTYSHRQTAHLSVDPAVPEGCVIATLATENPAQVVDPPLELTTIDANHWQFLFLWDATDTLQVRFTDASAETTQISAFPVPVAPLDPLQHEMPVLDIRTPKANLWDPGLGLYVFGDHDNCLQHGEEWERSALFYWYEGAESPQLVQEVGLRINGGWSRRYKQKGLRFYFDDYGTSDHVDHDFFGTEPATFQRLILRCGLDPRRCFTDALASDLFRDLGHLASRWAPVALYLNGEYWGFLPLRERIDEQFIEQTHQLDSGGYALIKDGQTLHGDASSFWAFINECQEPLDFSTHSWFLHAAETYDLLSYIDWLLINIYGATTDNGSAYNCAQFKPADGPWQFITWDEDGLFYSDNYFDDFFHFLSINSQEEYDQYLPGAIFSGSASARIRWAAPFRALLQNSEFKKLFADRYHELMATWFSKNSLTLRLNEIKARQEPEMARHGARWDWPTTTWYQTEANQLASWFTFRPSVLNNQFDDFMEYHRSPVELVDFAGSSELGSGVQLNWETASEENCVGFVLYRGEEPNDLSLLASWQQESLLEATGNIWIDANYSWLDQTSEPDHQYYYQLAWVDNVGTETPLNWLLEVNTSEPANLFINEYLALNLNGIQDETGAHEDWVEIFNAGPGAACLAGHFLTDDPALPTRWEFPDTTLAPGEFLLIWCDSDPEDGPMHTNFKLSAAGEAIVLSAPLAEGNPVLDSRYFSIQTADISEGRSSDGGSSWRAFSHPTPGQSNQSLSDAQAGEPTLQPALRMDSISPNPFNPSTRIRFTLTEAGPIRVGIYDLNGALVRSLQQGQFLEAGSHSLIWDGRNNGGQSLASGPYFFRLSQGPHHITAKLLLLK